MLSDVVHRHDTVRGNTLSGQRGSGHLAGRGQPRTLSRDNCHHFKWPGPTCKPYMRGAYVSQHLSFLVYGKAVGGQAKVRTGLGKSDRPGS